MPVLIQRVRIDDKIMVEAMNLIVEEQKNIMTKIYNVKKAMTVIDQNIRYWTKELGLQEEESPRIERENRKRKELELQIKALEQKFQETSTNQAYEKIS